MTRAAVVVGVLASCMFLGCGSDDDSSGNGLVGSWALYSMQVGTDAPAICPAQIDIGGYQLVCGDDDMLILHGDGTYTSSLDQIMTTTGTWKAVVVGGNPVIVFEDADDEDDPQAYIYQVGGNTLSISKSVFDTDAVLVFDRA